MAEHYEPGPELDAALAVKVMGWTLFQPYAPGTVLQGWPYGIVQTGNRRARVPLWSTDDGLAHEVIRAMEAEAMKYDGGFLTVEAERYRDADEECWSVAFLVWCCAGRFFRGQATHSTFAGAVAVAAIRAKEGSDG